MTNYNNIIKSISRGFKKYCPKCGHKDIYSSYIKFFPKCKKCNLNFSQKPGRNHHDVRPVTWRTSIAIDCHGFKSRQNQRLKQV